MMDKSRISPATSKVSRFLCWQESEIGIEKSDTLAISIKSDTLAISILMIIMHNATDYESFTF